MKKQSAETIYENGADTLKQTGEKLDTQSVFCELVNAKRYSSVLDQIPHELHEDLAVISCVCGRKEDCMIKRPVTNSDLEKNGITREKLLADAWHNTITKRQAVMRALTDILGENDEECPLYVLTNEDMCFGAVTIFYPLLLNVIADEFGDDVIVIPSSVHECLLLSAADMKDIKKLRAIIKNVNDTYVSGEEILSYNVYRYSRKDGSLTIDNT